MSNFELYLYYSLKIEPNDLIACEIKKNLNLSELTKHNNILKNKEVIEYFKNINEYCPFSEEPFIDTYYISYDEKDHNIKILFYKINNSDLITNSIINDSEKKNILTFIHRTLNLQNNLLSEYDNYYNYELDNILKFLSVERFYKLNDIYVKDPKKLLLNKSTFLLDEILKMPLYDYQKDNINWMIELQNNPIKEYISSDKLLFFPDGRIYNYSNNCFIKNEDRQLIPFKGGIILDDVGIGKTIQFLCLALLKTNLTTVILVPDHLESHWHSQFTKHFNIKFPNFIKIVKFSDFIDFKLSKYDTLIVDEIHELYSNPNNENILEKSFKTGCTYKWGITATPFPVPNSIYNIIKFLTEKENIYYKNLDRFTYLYDTYYKIFRKNTLQNIVKEVKLPNSLEHNIILEFNEQERILYDAETLANTNCDEQFLRKCCCDIMINYKNKNQIIKLTDFNNLVLDDYKNKYEQENNKLNEYIESRNNYEKMLNDNFQNNNNTPNLLHYFEYFNNQNPNDIKDNLLHFNNKINEQTQIVINRKQSYDYLNNKMNDINKKCPICLEKIVENESYDVPTCGHICCSFCMQYWLASNSSCSLCKKSIDTNKIYTISNVNQIKLNYSTKIDKLINIINQNNSKFIVYTQFENMISKLYETLNVEGIKSIKLETSNEINEIKNNNNIKVLILNSNKNASGIDLSFVSNIVIFEPIIGNNLFLRDIEKQIIGRIYRINQTENINVYRLIIKDTIEEDIYNKSLELK